MEFLEFLCRIATNDKICPEEILPIKVFSLMSMVFEMAGISDNPEKISPDLDISLKGLEVTTSIKTG